MCGARSTHKQTNKQTETKQPKNKPHTQPPPPAPEEHDRRADDGDALHRVADAKRDGRDALVEHHVRRLFGSFLFLFCICCYLFCVCFVGGGS